MRLVFILIAAVIVIVLLYYITVIFHLFTGMFGQNIPFWKTLIPFYGWTKWFKDLN